MENLSKKNRLNGHSLKKMTCKIFCKHMFCIIILFGIGGCFIIDFLLYGIFKIEGDYGVVVGLCVQYAHWIYMWQTNLKWDKVLCVIVHIIGIIILISLSKMDFEIVRYIRIPEVVSPMFRELYGKILIIIPFVNLIGLAMYHLILIPIKRFFI